MAAYKSSFLLYQGSQEWQISRPRDCFEAGWSCANSPFSKSLPVQEYSIPLENGAMSNKICWYLRIDSSNAQHENGKPAFVAYVWTNTNGYSIGKSVGLKSALIIFDEGTNVIVERQYYYNFAGNVAYNSYYNMYSYIKMEDIPRNSPYIKVHCTYEVFDFTTGTLPTQSVQAAPAVDKKLMQVYSEDLALMLDKDRVAGVNTDAVLKHGDKEYKVHKCVLSLQSDFFKARFSDRWEVKDGAAQTVDLNDPDLSPVLLEALISGAYTGKVENFDVAMKLLPEADKYQFQKLKEVCESVISSNLTRDNVMNIYLLANQFNAVGLKEKCETFVKM